MLHLAVKHHATRTYMQYRNRHSEVHAEVRPHKLSGNLSHSSKSQYTTFDESRLIALLPFGRPPSRPRSKGTILTDAPQGPRARWTRVRRLVTRVLQQQRDNAMGRHRVCREVADRSSVVRVGPEILFETA